MTRKTKKPRKKTASSSRTRRRDGKFDSEKSEYDDGLIPEFGQIKFLPHPHIKDPKTGRPFKIRDCAHAAEELFKLGNIRATVDEAAAFLGISKAALNRLFTREPSCKRAFDEGKEVGRLSQRRELLQLSKTNGAVAIFLAMNDLGLKDKRYLGLNPGGQFQNREPLRVVVKGGLPQRELKEATPSQQAEPVPATAPNTPIPLKIVSGDK